MHKADLLLASQSPRRKELLSQIGVSFDVLKVDVPELRASDESPEAYVTRLAISKSQAGSRVVRGIPVLGADTIVVCDGQTLEKPENETQAVKMLMALSGGTHTVMTACAISRVPEATERDMGANEPSSAVLQDILVKTEVSFRAITASEAHRYWATGEPCDKAGGYGIQGFGAVFVEQIKGSYSNVVGLPLTELTALLDAFDIPIWRNTSQ